MSCADAWTQMRPEALDFDVALIDLNEDKPRVVRRDPSWAESSRPLSDVAEVPPADSVLDTNAPLSAVLDRLGESDYVLLRDEGLIWGIVVLSDLRKPAATLWAFAVVLSVENALAMLVPSLTNRRWMNHLGQGRRIALLEDIERRKQDGSYISDEECLTLLDKLKLAHKILGTEVASKDEWKALKKGLIDLRNDIAHGRTLVTGSRSARDALHCVFELREFARRLWKLVDERPHVWDAYERTECSVDRDGTLIPVGCARADLPERFWMLSAQNPFERLVPDAVNERRHLALVAELRRRNAFVCGGTGSAPGDSPGWREQMAVAASLSREDACSVAALFGQRSVFEFDGEVFRVVEVTTRTLKRERRLDPGAKVVSRGLCLRSGVRDG